MLLKEEMILVESGVDRSDKEDKDLMKVAIISISNFYFLTTHIHLLGLQVVFCAV